MWGTAVLEAEMRSPARGAKINWTKTMAALRALAWSPLSSTLPPSHRHSVDRWQISVCVPPFLFETGARWVRSLSHFPTPCHLFFSSCPSQMSPFCLFLWFAFRAWYHNCEDHPLWAAIREECESWSVIREDKGLVADLSEEARLSHSQTGTIWLACAGDSLLNVTLPMIRSSEPESKVGHESNRQLTRED